MLALIAALISIEYLRGQFKGADALVSRGHLIPRPSPEVFQHITVLGRSAESTYSESLQPPVTSTSELQFLPQISQLVGRNYAHSSLC